MKGPAVLALEENNRPKQRMVCGMRVDLLDVQRPKGA